MKKQVLGQFFTVEDHWHDKLVDDFIAGHRQIVDPFAGAGDLLKSFSNHAGYDVDPTLGWPINDSLVSIPRAAADDVCITNPPYLGRSSGTRRGFTQPSRYFATHPDCDDLYKIALKICLRAFERVVAIVPESFLMSGELRDRLAWVNIIEAEMFTDTECPVLVAAWGDAQTDDFTVYKNGEWVGWWSHLNGKVPMTAPALRMKFNDPGGSLGLIAIDGSKDAEIKFVDGDTITGVTSASRSKTRINVPFSPALIEECNAVLSDLRECTGDVTLSPFKGNTRAGKRRRRLDWETGREVVSQAQWNLSASSGELWEDRLSRYGFGTRSKTLVDAMWTASDARYRGVNAV